MIQRRLRCLACIYFRAHDCFEEERYDVTHESAYHYQHVHSVGSDKQSEVFPGISLSYSYLMLNNYVRNLLNNVSLDITGSGVRELHCVTTFS